MFFRLIFFIFGMLKLVLILLIFIFVDESFGNFFVMSFILVVVFLILMIIVFLSFERYVVFCMLFVGLDENVRIGYFIVRFCWMMVLLFLVR